MYVNLQAYNDEIRQKCKKPYCKFVFLQIQHSVNAFDNAINTHTAFKFSIY